jgi:hypothetical protein
MVPSSRAERDGVQPAETGFLAIGEYVIIITA